MPNDIVERLRRVCPETTCPGCIIDQKVAADIIDELQAERALIVARAENAERAVGEFEHVGWQYRFPSIWGGHVWLDSDKDYNGSRCDQAREIFTKVTADDAHLSRKEGET